MSPAKWIDQAADMIEMKSGPIQVVPPSPTMLDVLPVIRLFLEKLELLKHEERAEIFNVIYSLNHPPVMIDRERSDAK